MFHTLYRKLISCGEAFSPLFLLLIRLLWGWQFILAGTGKLRDAAPIADYFQSLHIPFPLANVYLVGGVEFFGGALLLLGLFSRLAALPLIGTMVVAFLIAEREATLNFFHDPLHFIGLSPFTFLMAALTIFAFGPGFFSLDRFFKIEVAKK
jgi:putative oxidoreductase